MPAPGDTQPVMTERGEDMRARGRPEEDAVDAALLGAVARGDRAAFTRLHERHFSGLMRFLIRVSGRIEIAEEAACDTMLHVWRRAGDFRAESRVSTWIFGIGYRIAMNALRKAARERRRTEDVDDVGAETTDGYGDTVEALLRRRDLAAALASLSPELRAVVTLTYGYGYRIADIAAITGLPEGTVKSRMFHARSRLRAFLERTP